MNLSEDPYVYPGTQILRNRLEIREPDELEAVETTSTGRRLFELRSMPVTGRFDTAHLQAIHRYVFHDIYDWAGQFRTVNIAKSAWFARPEFISSQLHLVLNQLASEGSLIGVSREKFAGRSGYYLGELNAVHPFREGNGRTQREFIRQLGVQAGFTVRWSRVSDDQMRESSRLSLVSGQSEPLAHLLRIATE